MLDTNLLSNIAKLRLPDLSDERRAKLEPWTGVASRLDEADTLQAIICPEIPTLERELALTPMGPSIMDVARELSLGFHFPNPSWVECQQLYNAVVADRTRASAKPVSRSSVFNGEIDRWSSLFQYTVDLGYPNDPDEIRQAKAGLHSSAEKVFQDWETATHSFDQVYQKELRAFGPAVVRKYMRLAERVAAKTIDPIELNDPIVHVIGMVKHALEACGVSPEESMVEAASFMASEAAAMIPTNRIRAALYAYEAWKMADGMKKPTASFWLDVEMLSAVLPYCDAILTERHFAGALKEVKKYLPDECQEVRVYSVRKRCEFESYLDELIAAVPADQRAAAEALYLGKRG